MFLTALVNRRRKDRKAQREMSVNVQMIVEDQRTVGESRQKRDRLREAAGNRAELPEIDKIETTKHILSCRAEPVRTAVRVLQDSASCGKAIVARLRP
jgi:hypothetical protein